MKKCTKLFAVLMATLICAVAAMPGMAAVKPDAKDDFVITNPYANVDFSSVNTYKAALHNHTNASDGDPTLRQSIERHVQTGYDIVAITDHGTVNYTWAEPNENKLIHGGLKLLGRTEGDLDYLGTEGTFSNGLAYTYSTASNGDDYLVAGDRTVLRVPYGIENNALSVNAHVNGWFADYHDNSITTYVDAVRGVCKNGGVCVINHPGEYTKARYEIKCEDAYDLDDPTYRYYVNKFASLLEKYDNCIGLDVNSKGDGRTRFDRQLWDILLERFADNGDTVYAICSSDSHQLGKIDTGFTLALMPELTSAAFKSALLNGEFFGASRCIGNPVELADIAAALKEFYGETDIYNDVVNTLDIMNNRVEQIENGERDADDDIGDVYSVLGEDGIYFGETEPRVTNIAVDDAENTITVSTNDALIVRWISNGKQFAATKAGDASIDLDDYAGEIGNYVRAEVFGEGGVIYTQAFILNAEANKGTSRVVDRGFFDFGVLDFLPAVFGNWFDILGRIFKNL